MNILPGIKIVDLGLFIEKHKILIISDLHLGIEASLNKQGYLIPRFQFDEIKTRLKKMLEEVNPKTIIFNGDLKHEFGSIDRQEWNQILELFDSLKDKKIIVIEGNHDKILEPITKKRNLKIEERYDIDNITVIHGNYIPEKLNKIIIIGHEHPAISFPDRQDERYKCFLKGKYKNHDLLVTPSFSFLSQGTDIKRENLLSPFLQQSLKDFEIYVVEDKVYKFGKLTNTF